MNKPWLMVVQTEKQYNKAHGEDSVAITDGEDRLIFISPRARSCETVTHELVHAYLYEMCTHSADLNKDAMEEIFAELMARRGEELITLAKDLMAEIKERGL